MESIQSAEFLPFYCLIDQVMSRLELHNRIKHFWNLLQMVSTMENLQTLEKNAGSDLLINFENFQALKNELGAQIMSNSREVNTSQGNLAFYFSF
jgi:hypothetical protein